MKNLSKDQLWREIVKQNPSFETQGANISAKGLYKFYCLVWDSAQEYTKEITPEQPEVPWLIKNIFGS
jgi:hypothetical protein